MWCTCGRGPNCHATGHGAFALLSCHGKGIMLHFPCLCLSAMLYSASPMRMGGKGPHTFCRQNLRIVPKYQQMRLLVIGFSNLSWTCQTINIRSYNGIMFHSRLCHKSQLDMCFMIFLFGNNFHDNCNSACHPRYNKLIFMIFNSAIIIYVRFK